MQQPPSQRRPVERPLTRVIDGTGDASGASDAGEALSLILDAAGISYDLAKSAVEAVVENFPDLPDLG